MADKKISELVSITGANTAADDYFVVVDTSGAVTYKISREELNNAIEQDVLSSIEITDITNDVNVQGTVTADERITIDPAASNAYQADSTLSSYSTSNGVYLNGHNAGWLRLNGDGSNVSYLQINGASTATGPNRAYLTTNNTERFRVENNGDISFYDSTGVTQGFFWDASTQQLGLGTTSPQDALHIAKASAVLRIEDTDTNHISTIQSGASGLIITADAANTVASSYMGFSVDATERLRIDSSGNVGIGTSSPFSASQILNTGWSSGAPYGTVLTVTGNNTNDANWGHLLISDSTTTTGNGGSLRFAVGATESDLSPHAGIDGYTEGANYGGLKFLTRPNGGTSTERMRIDSSGRVGIGTSSPSASYKLHVAGSIIVDSSSILNLNGTSTATDPQLLLGQNGVGIFRPAADVMGFATNDNERMRIDSSGNLLLQKTSATNSGAGTYFQVPTAPTTMPVYLHFCKTFSGARDAIDFNHNGSRVGSVQFDNTSTSYNTSSDYRLKTAVNYDWDATTRLKQLKPARFEWIADGDDAVPVDGFLAHEVQDIVPEAITGTHNEVDDEGNPIYQGIDQSKLVPLLVKTIQELEARIAALEAN